MAITLRQLGLNIAPTKDNPNSRTAFNHIKLTINYTDLYFYKQRLFCIKKNGVIFVTAFSSGYFTLAFRNITNCREAQAAKVIIDNLGINSADEICKTRIYTKDEVGNLISEEPQKEVA